MSTQEGTRMPYILEYPLYHSRYKDITREDFEDHVGTASYRYWKGFTMNPMQVAFSEPTGFDTDTRANLTAKTKNYLIRIIELCRERDIPLLFIKTPYIIEKWHQEIYNTVADIAGDYDVPFINFNFYYDDMGLDFSTDIADNDHLNPLGNAKFTRYLASYIESHYDIPDRRIASASTYESYQKMSEMCSKEVYNWQAKDVLDLPAYVNYLSAGNYITVYSLDSEAFTASNYPDVANILKAAANIDATAPEESSSSRVWVSQAGQIIYAGKAQDRGGSLDSEEAATTETQDTFVTLDAAYGDTARSINLWHTDLGEGHLLFVSVDEGGGIEVNYDHSIYRAAGSGLNILSYDPLTQSLVESAGFNLSDGMINYTKQIEERSAD